MSRTRGVLLCLFLALSAGATCAANASAQTFFVNERGASATCLGKGSLACPTIKEAVTQAEKSAPPNTIELEPEEGLGATYKETIALVNPKASGLTIEGSEAGVTVVSNLGPTVTASMTGNVTLANFTLVTRTPSVLKSAIAARHLGLTLDNMKIVNEDSGGTYGVEALEGASVTMNGGSVEMESTEGYGAFAVESPLSLSGVTILGGAAAPDESGGVFSEKSTLSVSNSTVSLSSGTPAKAGIRASKDSSVTLENDTVKQGDHGTEARGVLLEASPASVNGLKVEMGDPTSEALAVGVQQLNTSSSFSHLQIGGAWRGAGMLMIGGSSNTLSDSRIVTNPVIGSPPLLYGSAVEGPGLLLQRSVLQAPNTAEASLFAEGANVTLDSSEVLGGLDAVKFEQKQPGQRVVTISASTVDANAPGTASDAPGVNGVFAQASTEPGALVNVRIQGSIVLEKQAAIEEAGDKANILCVYSAIPNQAQAEGAGSGGIECTSGPNGNAESNPIGALLAEPFTNYELLPGSSAADSVPAAQLALPFGLTPSSTDLAGNPRVVDGNGDCVALQDKGALELQGHSAPCPIASHPAGSQTPAAKPAITALAIAPGAFRAAPSGATLAKKKKYGAALSWRDSQAATSTFTVYRLVSGRRQGHSCKLPSGKNRHGKKCTLKVKVGTFTHTDRAGADSGHFSGRLKRRALAAGSYQLVVVPSNANGTGGAVSRAFKIL